MLLQRGQRIYFNRFHQRVSRDLEVEIRGLSNGSIPRSDNSKGVKFSNDKNSNKPPTHREPIYSTKLKTVAGRNNKFGTISPIRDDANLSNFLESERHYMTRYLCFYFNAFESIDNNYSTNSSAKKLVKPSEAHQYIISQLQQNQKYRKPLIL